MISVLRAGVGLTGVGAAVPAQIVTNDDLSKRVETSHDWIVERTGIHERRVASNGETVASLALDASRSALERAGLAPADLDQVMVATCTPDYYFPATAATLADALGAHAAGACDVSAACTGFVYGVVNAAAQVAAGLAENVLVVGSEILSRIVDWDDRSTCVLFGDGAGAVVVSATAGPARLLAAELGADGSKGGDLFARSHLKGSRFLAMNGPEVYRFATRVMIDSVERLLQRAEVAIDEVDWVIPHQANIRIIEHSVRRLGIDPARVITNLDRYGNTSAASIPLCLEEGWADGRVTPGDRLLFVGFGGGLTWGSCLIEWVGSQA